MRVCRLDLLRYGCFTDAVLELPLHNPDIHIVFGPNEAGKSTALSALEDLLFGIPNRSPLNFLHDYGSMRVGAVLEKDNEIFEVRRRKGNKDTLLTTEEVPIPVGDGALASFLAGADRDFFVRMFSLDHARLRQGGREILEARDEVGQMLFSASAGIGGLRDRLRVLEEKAEGLWAPRRAAHRKYYVAQDRLKMAEDLLREHTVTASKWQKLKRNYKTAQNTYDALEQKIEGKSAQQRKLSRIRRVYRDVRGKSELDDSIAALGQVTPLPEDARQSLEKAEQDEAHAATRIETLTEQLEAARKERTALTCDEELLPRAEDIQQLHERRIQVRAGKADLPKRRAELASAEEALRRLATELEWEAVDIDQLVSRIPARSKLAGVRTLLNRRGELLSGKETAQTTLQETVARLTEITQQRAELGASVDVSTLAAVIEVTRESSDLASRIKDAEGEARETQAAIQRHLASLRPHVSDEEALTSVHVPPRDTMQSHRDTHRELDQRFHACRERIRTAEQELVRHRKAHERVARDEHAVPLEELARVRQHRDSGWSLIRRRYVEGTAISEEDVHAFIGLESDLSDAYETAVRKADEAADQRFDKAEAAARLAVISRQIAEQEDLLEALRTEDVALNKTNQTLNADWENIWTDFPFSLLSPNDMLEWAATRTEVLNLVGRRAKAEREITALCKKELETRGRLLAELEMLGVGLASLTDQPLRVTLEAAIDVQRQYEQTNETKRQFTEELRRATTDTEHKHKAVDKAGRAWSEWQDQWTNALSGLGLGAMANPDAVSAQINAIDEMREIAVRVNELRHERIGTIERYIADFGRDVSKIVNVVATDLAGTDPEEAVLELERRLDDARRIRDLQKDKDEVIASFEEKIEEYGISRGEAREIISHLQDAAGVESIDELGSTIERSDNFRNLKTQLSRVTKTLMEEGDGLSIAELHNECEAVDFDQIAAREETLAHELDEMREHLMETRELRSQAEQAFKAVGEDDSAAKAAADRQAALAEIKEVAEQYVRVRSAALLLTWAIDRYRREKQAPLLKRAGELFAVLTGGSFVNLQLEFDEEDHAHLAGLRSDGSKVGVEGMSTGTADQLYLALRIASIEDYLERASPLPFVADDLFINFDDARAASGFQVLGELGYKTQVLFFTHHKHLLEIARSNLGATVSTISLADKHPVGRG